MQGNRLRGRGIVVTRPRGLAGELARRIEEEGGRAILFPAIEIEDVPAPPALARLESYDLAVFVSPTAAQKALAHVKTWPARVRAAAVGEGTRRELERLGLEKVIAPRGVADSEALLELPELAALAGARVVVFRGGEGRRLLGERLAERGARVEFADCYRRAVPRADPASLLELWRGGAVHAVTVTSAEGLDNLFALLGDAPLRATPIFVPHSRVAAHARERGVKEALVAGPTDAAMAERLVAYFDGRA